MMIALVFWQAATIALVSFLIGCFVGGRCLVGFMARIVRQAFEDGFAKGFADEPKS